MKKKNRNFIGMKKWFILMGLFGVVFTSLFSCGKGGTAINEDSGPHYYVPDDSIAPVLQIATPAPDQVFLSGNTINVTGRITDENGLYRGSVRITKDANGEIVKEQLYEIHGILDYSFSVNETATVTTASDYTVTVWFEDHGLNKTTKNVKVKVNP